MGARVISEAQVEKALDYLRSTAEEAAVAKAQMVYMAEWIKCVRSKVKTNQSGMSNAAAEDVALTSTEYFAALEGYRDAVKEDSFYRFKREAAEALIEAWRTQSSNLRAEGKAYA